ncbi:guanine-1-methyltransferase-domain-containing protein [Neohortaea acidophila]|uniref:tRNA (guanine(9)-N1)-methyltransferase n=1 Tax=Neohortaea acidophila TaxID=245834 RepID=A0A6A6PQU9_9PEZI|nr:guanine-1-methyltransferase-domain-containing protein [Neohortaea acidophila]KAF2482004.1 guanine-1-methyltransferase-domain-containing protein [Neohortaea acidophila]
MEAEERITKKRKLSNDRDPQKPVSDSLTQGNGGSEVSTTGGDLISIIEHDDEEPSENLNGAGHAEGDTFPTPATTAPLADGLDTAGAPVSKNQLKKLRKKQEWESKRDERKEIRRQKTVAKRERKREAWKQMQADGEAEAIPAKHLIRRKAVQLPVTILIDCDFDGLMKDKERISLAAQLTRSYSDNRNAPFRAHLAISAFGGSLRERFDNVLMHYKGWRGVRFLDCDCIEAAEKAKEWMASEFEGKMGGAFEKFQTEDVEDHARLKAEGEVVYLTSEAEETLTELKPFSTYIIGGLVDKNREKGLCYKRATERGLKTARLPIGEFMDMQSRKVLAVNHVNEIMLKWLECGDWGEAFVKVIPKRKGGQLKDAKGAESKESPGDEAASDDGDETFEDAEEALEEDATSFSA